MDDLVQERSSGNTNDRKLHATAPYSQRSDCCLRNILGCGPVYVVIRRSVPSISEVVFLRSTCSSWAADPKAYGRSLSKKSSYEQVRRIASLRVRREGRASSIPLRSMRGPDCALQENEVIVGTCRKNGTRRKLISVMDTP